MTAFDTAKAALAELEVGYAAARGSAPFVAFSLDPSKAANYLAAGRHIVILAPNSVEIHNANARTITWKLSAMSYLDYLKGWEELDTIAAILSELTAATEYEYQTFTLHNGKQMPGIQLTFTTEE